MRPDLILLAAAKWHNRRRCLASWCDILG